MRPLVSRPIGAATVSDFLVSRGLIDAHDRRPTVTVLTGGVSGTVLLVEGDRKRMVVKQALARLLVEAEWFATPERAVTEAAAIELLHTFTPDFLPALVAVSTADCALVMTAAPRSWDNWKQRLLTQPVDVSREQGVASTLGFLLAEWHRRTTGDAAVARRFNDYDAFEQLRVTPFHRTVLAQHPPLTPAIEACIADLTTTRQCLVHGDFSPKNILVGAAEELWVLDFEVAHYGAAVFDLAFLHTHLLLKAVHRPDQAVALRTVAMTFAAAYATHVGPTLGPEAIVRLGWHTGCLLLARASGTSPAGYLTPPQRAQVSWLGTRVLETPDRPIEDLWALMEAGE